MIGVKPRSTLGKSGAARARDQELAGEPLGQSAIALESAVDRTEADLRGFMQPVIPGLFHLWPGIPEGVPAAAVARNDDSLLVQGRCVDPVADDASCSREIHRVDVVRA